MGMPLEISWSDITLRLALTVVAGLVLGYDRTAHGKAAGMRTAVLVCLAASVAMIQMNLLLPTAGRPPGSFVMNDLMRLPLGILTGIGFIGAGAIVRRGDVVEGVTTAATIWLLTVIGLCIGGGQIGLGLVATAIGLFALRGLAWVEARLPQMNSARLALEFDAARTDEAAIRQAIGAAGTTILDTVTVVRGPDAQHKLAFDVRVPRTPNLPQGMTLVERLASEPGLLRVELQ